MRTTLLALTLSACCPAAAKKPSPSPQALRQRYANPIIAAQYEATVKLKVDCIYPEWKPKDEVEEFWAAISGGPPKSVQGSGAAVGPGAVVTARHVVDCNWDTPSGGVLDGEAWKITATTRRGQKVEVVVEGMGEGPAEQYPRRDVAILVTTEGRSPFGTWARVADRIPDIGDEVCVLAAVPNWGRLCGKVQDFLADGEWFLKDEPGHPEWGGDGYFTYDAWTTYGTSGGVVYDVRGELVGVNVGIKENLKVGYLAAEFRHLIPKTWADLGLGQD